jgi:predicted RNA-binding Zn ribbon-like protein
VTYAFHRGSLALDLAGTVGARASDAPEERMPGRGELARWLEEAGLVERAEPSDADLAAAHALREAIHAAATDVLEGRPVRRAALATLNRAAQGLRLGAPQLTPALGTRWESAAPVAVALGRVAADAIEVLSRHADRLTRCELDGCGALLLSRSRGEARRWCSMETCGNRAKAAAFRRRRRRRGA